MKPLPSLKTNYPLAALLCVLGPLAPAEVNARIGEREEQIEKRYGKPVEVVMSRPRERAVLYKSGDLEILITYFDQRSHAESYTPVGHFQGLSETTIQFLLEANSEGAKWTPHRTMSPAVKAWRFGGRLLAYAEGQPTVTHLYVITVEYQQRVGARKKQEQGATQGADLLKGEKTGE